MFIFRTSCYGYTKVTSIYLQCSTTSFSSLVARKVEKLFMISLLTCKTLREKQPVYLHSILAISLPSRSLRSNKGISMSVPRVKTNTDAGYFTLVLHLFGTTTSCLSIQPIQLLPSRNISRHISLTWPFPHRHRHAQWPVDVTKLFLRFCCWTLIQLSHCWAWLRQGYWHYRNFTNWYNIETPIPVLSPKLSNMEPG